MKQPRMLSNEEWEVIGEACGFIHKTYEEYREWKQKRVKWEPGMLAWDVFEKKMCVWKKEYDTIPYSSIVWHPPTNEQLDEYEAQNTIKKTLKYKVGDKKLCKGRKVEITKLPLPPWSYKIVFMDGNGWTYADEHQLSDLPDSEHDPKSINPEKNPIREIGSSAMWDGRLYFSLGNAATLKVNSQKVTVIATDMGSADYKISTASGTNHYVNANQLSYVSDPANTCSPSLASPADVDEFPEEHKAEKESKPSHEYKAKDTVIWDGMGYRDDGLNHKISDPCEVRIIEVLSMASVFDYEIRYNGIGWVVHDNQLTPIPDKKLFKDGDIVWDIFGGADGKIISIDGDAVKLQLKNGDIVGTRLHRIEYIDAAQVDEYYTVTIDGVEYRFYKCNGVLHALGTTMEGNIREPMIGLSLMSFLVRDLINQHYKHLVLSVNNVEEMIAPTKGEIK